MVSEKILDFYKKTSVYTDLGLYREFAMNLPDNIQELCLLQRNQIIHPFDLSNEEMRNDSNSCYGNMRKIPITDLCYEKKYGGAFFVEANSMAEFVQTYKNKFGEAFYSTDIIIISFEIKLIWVFHHEGVCWLSKG